VSKRETRTLSGSLTPWLDAAAPDQSRPPYRVAFTPNQSSESELAASDRLIVELLDARPSWLDIEAGIVDEQLLRKVPVGPTLALGFGGSALGSRAALEFAEVAGLRPGPQRILDTVDPWVVGDCLDWAVACNAKLLVVSKSGNTIEVLRLLDACLSRGLEAATLISDPISDPIKPGEGAGASLPPIVARVREASNGEHVELTMPAQVGGRWSVLTAVGQVPLRAANLDPMLLTHAAINERDRLASGPAARESLARSLAWRLANPAPYSLLWCYSEVLMHWAAWTQQLECESLGRVRDDGSRVGELVAALRGPADQHSLAQLLLDGPARGRVTFADFDDDPGGNYAGDLADLARLRVIEREATCESMTLPTRTLLVRDRSPASLGALMLHGMIETAVTAATWSIDPYGQPAVEQIKRGINARL
jgi:glucose-6-phosphate isomerase